MDLKQYDGKIVRAELDDGQILCGYAGDYIWPDDNENGEESIVVEVKNRGLIEIYAKEIKQIEVLKQCPFVKQQAVFRENCLLFHNAKYYGSSNLHIR